MPRALAKLRACHQLVALLLDGKTLDRESVAKTLNVEVAAADRHLKAMIDTIPHLEVDRGPTRRRRVRLRAGSVGKAPSLTTAVGASFGSSLAKLFRGSAYEGALRAALAHVLERAPRRAGFKDWDRKFLFVTQGGEAALPEKEDVLDEIVEGLLSHHVVRIRDAGFDGGKRARLIQPLSLAVYQHQLYLVGWVDGKRIVVRFARIASAEVTSKRFDYPARAEYDPDVIFRDSLGIFIKDDPVPIKVEFRLDSTWAHYALSHRWHVSQQVQKTSEGVVVTMMVRHCHELEQLLLGFGEHVEVLAPQSLKDAFERRVLEAAERIKHRRAGPSKRTKKA